MSLCVFCVLCGSGWSFHAENAWINKIEGPTFKAAANEIAMESVELVHEGLTIEM